MHTVRLTDAVRHEDIERSAAQANSKIIIIDQRQSEFESNSDIAYPMDTNNLYSSATRMPSVHDQMQHCQRAIIELMTVASSGGCDR